MNKAYDDLQAKYYNLEAEIGRIWIYLCIPEPLGPVLKKTGNNGLLSPVAFPELSLSDGITPC